MPNELYFTKSLKYLVIIAGEAELPVSRIECRISSDLLPAVNMQNPVRQIVILIAVLLTVTSCDAQEDSSGEDVQSIILHDGSNRVYDLHIPESVDADPVALVIALHGAGDSGPGMKRAAGLDREADRRGFLAAYPSATGVNWAEGCNCVRPDLDGVDDLGFVDSMIEDIASRYPVDRDRVYVIGYSQGGLFAQHLACERSGSLAGVATVSGLMSLPVASGCDPEGSPDMMFMHGEEDPVLPFEGIPSGLYATLSVYDAFLFWRSTYECPFGTERVTNNQFSVTRDIRTTPACRSGARVRMDAIKGVGHAWPPFGPAEIADFFGL